MKAMLLAAGVGRRMLPLTLDVAKPTIPVLGRALAVQILQWLASHGIDEAVVNLHHRPASIRSLLGTLDAETHPEIRYSDEAEILGTSGALRRAAPLLRDGRPIVVCNSDFLSDIDLSAVVEAHRRSDASATLVLAPPRPEYSVVCTDELGRIVSLAGEPRVPRERIAGEHLFTGCHVIDEAVLDLIPVEDPSDIVRDVYRRLAAEGRLGSWLHDGFWWEFGSPATYLEGSLRLLDLPAATLRAVSGHHDTVKRIGSAVAAIGAASTCVDPKGLVGRVALGYASRISGGCRIEDSVVMPEAWLGPDCRLTRVVVGPGAELPAGFEAKDQLVCADGDPAADPPAATRRVRGLLVHDFGGRVQV